MKESERQKIQEHIKTKKIKSGEGGTERMKEKIRQENESKKDEEYLKEKYKQEKNRDMK